MVEKFVNLANMDEKLDDFSKVLFYVNVIGLSYSESGRNEECIDFYNKVLDMNPIQTDAYNNKACHSPSLAKMKRPSRSITRHWR